MHFLLILGILEACSAQTGALKATNDKYTRDCSGISGVETADSNALIIWCKKITSNTSSIFEVKAEASGLKFRTLQRQIRAKPYRMWWMQYGEKLYPLLLMKESDHIELLTLDYENSSDLIKLQDVPRPAEMVSIHVNSNEMCMVYSVPDDELRRTDWVFLSFMLDPNTDRLEVSNVRQFSIDTMKTNRVLSAGGISCFTGPEGDGVLFQRWMNFFDRYPQDNTAVKDQLRISVFQMSDDTIVDIPIHSDFGQDFAQIEVHAGGQFSLFLSGIHKGYSFDSEALTIREVPVDFEAQRPIQPIWWNAHELEGIFVRRWQPDGFIEIEKLLCDDTGECEFRELYRRQSLSIRMRTLLNQHSGDWLILGWGDESRLGQIVTIENARYSNERAEGEELH